MRGLAGVLRRRALTLGIGAVLALWSITGQCSGENYASLLHQFVDAFAAGSMRDLPLAPAATGNGLDAREQYEILFATSRERQLTFRNVRWADDGRITADYIATVDGVEHAGSVTMYAAADRITRIVHDYQTWQESEAPALASAGQIADKATTAVGLASDALVEGNPILHGLNAGGMLALGAVMVGLQQFVVRDLPLSDCIVATRWMGAVGWGAGVNNALALTGVAAPVAPIVGIVAGVVAWNQDYKGECVDGDVQIAELRSLSKVLTASR